MSLAILQPLNSYGLLGGSFAIFVPMTFAKELMAQSESTCKRIFKGRSYQSCRVSRNTMLQAFVKSAVGRGVVMQRASPRLRCRTTNTQVCKFQFLACVQPR